MKTSAREVISTKIQEVLYSQKVAHLRFQPIRMSQDDTTLRNILGKADDIGNITRQNIRLTTAQLNRQSLEDLRSAMMVGEFAIDAETSGGERMYADMTDRQLLEETLASAKRIHKRFEELREERRPTWCVIS